MAQPLVYVESTIPSVYFEVRATPEIVAKKNWTRSWWSEHRTRYQLVSSEAVLDELNRGDYPFQDETIALLDDVPLVAVEDEIASIVETYIRHAVMPANPTGDALHLALASFHKCDFLLTWNCQHLANANKFQHIRHVNTLLGLYCPALVTPLELLGGFPDDG